MVLFALSIAPGIAISLYFFFRDEYNREPRMHLLISFFLGMLSGLIALMMETAGLAILEGSMPAGILYVAIKAFIIVAFSEEWAKYVMVRRYAFPKKAFDEPFDGIVYSVMVSMGFATLENIGYVMEYGFSTAIVRMFLSVPAHACFAVLMGYYLGKAKFEHDTKRMHIWKGLFAATFFHGCFDFFLFLQEDGIVAEQVSNLLLFFGALSSYFIALYLSRKAVRVHVATSRELHGPDMNAGRADMM